MSFKLLIKQAFRSLFKKLRLYLSLILFLFVAFSILNGTATYFNSWEHNMHKILETGQDENFEIPKFRFSSADTKDKNKAIYKFSNNGQIEFENYIKKIVPDHVSEETDWKTFINQLGQGAGDLSSVSEDNDFINDLNNKSAIWGHNIMQMFLADKLITKLNVQIGTRDAVQGTEAKHRNITFKIRPLTFDDKTGPYDNNELNKITHYKTKIKPAKKDYIPFYVSQNYLRYTDSKIGDSISVVVNNNPFNGYIAGTAVDKYHIFFNNDSAELFVDQKTLGEMTNDGYINAEELIGYLPIKNSKGSFKNPWEFDVAFKRIESLLLSDGNSPNDLETFQRVDTQTRTTILSQLNGNNSTLSFYNNPLNIYIGFMIILIIVLIVLVIIVSYFIIDESIRSEKNTLWFLKSLGVSNFKLSLLNSLSAFVPLFIALCLTVPGTMLIMEFFTIAISTDYAFSIPWYALTYISAIVFVCLLIGILLIFVVINEGLISGKGLSVQSTDKMSKFQYWLAKVTNPLVKRANGKFRVGFAFVKQNLIKNFVTFILFLIVFSISLFGIQFMRSIHNQEYQYQNWMGDYHAISTLSPKQTITWDKTNTTYETISNEELASQQKDADKKDGLLYSPVSYEKETEKHLADTYKYDMFKYVAENWFNGLDYEDDTTKTFFEKPGISESNYLVFDSKTHEILNMPDTQTYYTDLMKRLELLFGFGITNYCNYSMADLIWGVLNNNDPVTIIPNASSSDALLQNPNKEANSDFYKSLEDQGKMNDRKKNSGEDNVSVAQWSLRQFKNLSLWGIDKGYVEGLDKKEHLLPKNIQELVETNIDKLLANLPKQVQPAFQSIDQVLKAQHDIFGVKYPSFGINFGKIIKPEASTNPKSAVALNATYRGTPLLAYGMNDNDQPFTNPIKLPKFDGKALPTVKNKEDGMTYEVIDSVFSANAKNQNKWEKGDIVPLDTTQTGLNPSDNKNYLALRIDGFDDDDSVLTEAFFDKSALNYYITHDADVAKGFKLPSIDNTLYTKDDVPYFLQHITIPHMMNDGTSIDDYIYTLDTFTSNHKTTLMITKVFADTVDSYSSLMEKVIILLVVIALAISSIIITLIMLENKKTILLFKAMGYRKRDVIWYIISGYLIASLAALGISFGISAGATIGLAPVFAQDIFLQLTFTAYWLWFVLGFILTVGFMAIVIISIVTYTRYLKPRDAFATL